MRSDEEMQPPPLERRYQAWILVGVLYALFGLIFGALAGGASSTRLRDTWRLLAWLISGVAFAAQIGYEHFRLRNSSVTTAFHAALAAALGAFGLAAAANIHSLGSGSRHHGLLAAMFVVWPVLAGVPAFVVALGLAALLGLWRRDH